MPISPLGALNTTALIVPDLYVQIVPPSIAYLNGVPTNVLGVVGTASWGPVNAPTTIGSMADYAREFGPIKARANDLGTAVAAATLQGASNFRCVRVALNAVAASATIGTGTGAGIVLTGKHTGSLGNEIKATISAGSKTSSWRLTVSLPGRSSEVFDNIEGTGTTVWDAMVAQVMLGNGSLRGPSELVSAAKPSTPGTAIVATAATALSGGSDGTASLVESNFIGDDGDNRTGMYALRGTGCSVATLAEVTGSWPAQVAFGLSEGTYMVMAMPGGVSLPNITTSVAAKASAGVDHYTAKLMLGDWAYFSDTVNGQLRLISPASFVAGKLVSLPPQHSTLNKQLYGVVGTQRSAANRPYSTAELQQLAEAGIDVVTNPVPGGNYFGCRIGHNTSSNTATNGDNYTRLTNYIASTINAGMGRFIGRLQTPSERREAKVTLESFLANMEQQGQIGTANGDISYSVRLDDSNNPKSRVALGYQQADVKVIYLSIVEKFLVNVEGGQTVTVERISTELA